MKTQVATCALLTAVAVVGLGMTPALAEGELSDRTIIVSPAEFNSWRGNCTNLRAALDGITDASDGKPYTVLVEPSIYRCDDNPVNIPAWVSVEALGIGVVEIRSTVELADVGAVNMHSHSSIVGLSILNSGPGVVSGFAISVRDDTDPIVGATGVLIKYSIATSTNSDAVTLGPCSSATIKGSTLNGDGAALLLENDVECTPAEADPANAYVSNSWLIGAGPVVVLDPDTMADFIDNGWTPEVHIELGEDASAQCTTGNSDPDDLSELGNGGGGGCEED